MGICRLWKNSVPLESQLRLAVSRVYTLKLSHLVHAEACWSAVVQGRRAKGQGMPQNSAGFFHSTRQGTLTHILSYLQMMKMRFQQLRELVHTHTTDNGYNLISKVNLTPKSLSVTSTLHSFCNTLPKKEVNTAGPFAPHSFPMHVHTV